jgi:hypothetical protein
MSVNVRWNGRGWPGKVPRSPVASPEKAKEQGNWYGKDSRPKGTVKSRMAKNENGKFKKKKIKTTDWIQCIVCKQWLHENCTGLL